MTLTGYESILHTERQARLRRLNMRAPEAGPLVVKLPAKVVPLVNGLQVELKPLPVRDWLRVASFDRMPKRLTVARIQDIAAKKFKMTRAQLLAKRRTRDYVRPRQMAMYLAVTRITELEFAAIARRFDVDRKTLWHGKRKIEALRAGDLVLDAELTELEAILEREANLGGAQ